MSPSERIRIIIIERKVAKDKGEIDEYDVSFGHESTSFKALMQYLDQSQTLEISKILANVMTGKYGTKNRSELISSLQGIIIK